MISNINNSDGDGLATLTAPRGTVPETRLANAREAQAMVQQMIQADSLRDRKRALVKGLVDGNPPYRADDLRKAGRANACNVNWRIAESYLDTALSAFYDVFSEAPTFSTVTLNLEGDRDAVTKSQIATEEFQRLLKQDKSFDYNMQISQHEMVLYGCGPMFFEDKHDWRCKVGRCRDLLVNENEKSDAAQWELAIKRTAYKPHQLYEFIRNPEAAKNAGWDVQAVKDAIMNARPESWQGGQYQNWEFYQQQLKNSSFYYSTQAKKIFVAHIWFKEFPKEGEVEGRISHKIVLENYGAEDTEGKFLFERIGRYKNWAECVHPMYYDHGGGGEHHSVTGMGVKMYSAVEYQNRLICANAEKAFAPKVMFKPTTADSKQKLSIAQFGEYAVVPSNLEYIQTPISGQMQDGVVFNREISQMLASNLSQYRQSAKKEDGNPITATEANINASEQARLGKTQLNRYYEQLDGVYEQQFRRAVNPNLTPSMPGGREALEFQERCFKRGLTKTDLNRIESVKATRIAGQGSAHLRQAALEFMLGLIQTLPEDGRQNVIDDTIASRLGQSFVKRYNPKMDGSTLPTDQASQAQDKIVGMKIGMPPLVSQHQNPVIFAQAYLQAASQALQSLQQGANPSDVLRFVELAGGAIHAQLQRIAQDPLRKQAYDVLYQQWKELAGLADKLKAQVQQQQEQQAQQQQEAQAAQQEGQAEAGGAQSKIAIKAAETAAKIKMAEEKNNSSLEQARQKHLQDLAIKDAQSAQKIRQGGTK